MSAMALLCRKNELWQTNITTTIIITMLLTLKRQGR